MGIVQRILDREMFGSGSSQEIGVGGHEGKRRQGLSLGYRAGFESRGELHGIIRTKTVTLSQIDSAVDNRPVYGNKRKMLVAVLKKRLKTRLRCSRVNSRGLALLS